MSYRIFVGERMARQMADKFGRLPDGVEQTRKIHEPMTATEVSRRWAARGCDWGWGESIPQGMYIVGVGGMKRLAWAVKKGLTPCPQNGTVNPHDG